MHKYTASKRQRVYHLICLLYPASLAVFTVFAILYMVHNSQGDVLVYLNMLFLTVLSISGIAAYIWKFLDDPILGKFSFDKAGVTFYTPIRTITFRYDECADIGFTHWPGGGLITTKYIYYIYFSKKLLTVEQRSFLFMGRSKKKRGKRNMPLYQSEYVLFQYRPDVFADFIECVPTPFRERLIQTEKELNLKTYE